ncbi:MAG: choice-of-anchor D domain-containing protein, partial [Spartobacteria bacterium]|nr:choice-of-anchor D domain-containing protein [Spartobacteria bacterium]
AGGNTITITNGYFGTITNVLVDGIDVSAIVDSGVNWVNVVMPLLGAAGTVDITIQTSDNGDTILPNAYTYNPAGSIATFLPSSCFWTGNCPVIISGANLCNGGLDDITRVTLAGVTAAVDTVNGATQILVTAAMSTATTGDVEVNSISHGVTVSSNAFTYYEPVMTALGTNGAAIASGDAASSANGADFGALIVNLGALTNTFSITNSGNTALNISGVSTSGAGASSFTLTTWPGTVAVGDVEAFTVIFEPDGGGSKSAALNFTNDGTNNPYVVNLAGYGRGGGIALATNDLSFVANYAGSDPAWQSVEMDNVGLSSFTYTNVLLYGPEGSNWMETWPNNGTVGIGGATHLTNLITISALNAGHYTCMVQVTAFDATNSPQSYLVDLTVNQLTQTITFAQLSDMIITDTWGLSATGGASTNPVTFSVLSGPASINGGTNLSFSNVGEVQIAANQAGDINYIVAPTVTNVFNVSPTTPEISTPTVSNILSQTAAIGATIDTTNGSAVTVRGIIWQVEGDTNVYSASESGAFGDGAFSMNVTGIIAGVTNAYQVYAQNVSGTVYTVESSFLARPDAPESLAASAIDTYSFQANWNAAIGATNYLLDVALDTSFSNMLPLYNSRVVETALNIPVTGLTESTTYFYRLRSENAQGIGTNTATITVRTLTEGAIGLDPVIMTFAATYDYMNPDAQSCAMTNFGQTAFDFTNAITYSANGAGWLTATPNIGSLPPYGSTVFTCAVDIASLNAGTYIATNTVISPTATNSPQAIRATLVVAPATQTIVFAQLPDMIITDTWGLSATGGNSTNPVTFAVLSGPAAIAGGTNLTFNNVGEVQIIADQ